MAQSIPLKLRSYGVSDRDLLALSKPASQISNLSFRRLAEKSIFTQDSPFDSAQDSPFDSAQGEANFLHGERSRTMNSPISGLFDQAYRVLKTNNESVNLRILAIRVEFQEDSNSLTTGNGKFDLSPQEAVIDSPPHDLKYFADQLLALSNYYKSISNGKLILEAEVFPKGPTDSYRVSQQISYYAPTGSEELLDQRLSELFQEGFQLADTSDEIDFSQYDSFIIFHAGVGSDFAFDFDPTPQDIPSVFLDFQTLKKNLGRDDPNFQGIPVNRGRYFIRDGIILPETQSQEGFEIGLLGTMAIMFGHQLGLPNLFNTETGIPGIGVFGLMDQGSGNFSGLLPAEPCAWSKIFLGWEDPIEIKNGENLAVAASRATNLNKIYKIPIDTKEYFLIENRQRDFNKDSLAVGRDAHGNRVEFKWDNRGQRILTEGIIGVITQVDDYDFGLPGSGLLIWHIDERVIEANLAANRVNADPERRGVDLEEADGAQDIGQVYGLLHPAAGQENGTVWDMFWASNEINMQVNSSDVVAFSPTSRPNSSSNSGANTHIIITNFSEPDSIMTFSVRNNISQSGFPQFTGSSKILTNSPIIADLNNDGLKEIVLNSYQDATIYVWNFDGSKFIANQDSVKIQKLNGDFEKRSIAVFAKPPGTILFSPAIAPLNDQYVVVAVTDHVVAAYLPVDSDFNGRADSLFVSQGNDELTTEPLVINLGIDSGQFLIIVGTINGNILAIDQNGTDTLLRNVSNEAVAGLAALPQNRIAFTTNDGVVGLLSIDGNLLWMNDTNWPITKAPAVGDLNSDGQLNIITVSDAGVIFVFEENGDISPAFPKDRFPTPSSQIALGDIDGDDFLEIVFLAEHELYAFSHVGSLIDGFPVQISTFKVDGINSLLISSPILADVDGDEFPEIILGSDKNKLEAFHGTGKSVTGFPLSTGKNVNSTATVDDLDQDGDIEVAVASEDGFLYVWDLSGIYKPENIPWGSYFHDALHSNAILESLQPSLPAGQLMPPKLVYNYPNPTEGNLTTIRYTLNFPAQVRIKIYDLAGELVDELEGPGFAQTENEVPWLLDKIESGVYLARVEAQGDGKREVAIFKIAVVK